MPLGLALGSLLLLGLVTKFIVCMLWWSEDWTIILNDFSKCQVAGSGYFQEPICLDVPYELPSLQSSFTKFSWASQVGRMILLTYLTSSRRLKQARVQPGEGGSWKLVQCDVITQGCKKSICYPYTLHINSWCTRSVLLHMYYYCNPYSRLGTVIVTKI